jgi:diadenosine tetraphosphate (Ap4A) HIT family hydrolase
LTATAERCLVCRELEGDVEVPGGLLYVDDLVVVMHMPPLPDRPSPYLGHLQVVPRRHVSGLDGLTDDEAAAIGQAVARVSRALRGRTGVERIYSAVIGQGVDHLHVHLFPRYAGTPQDVPWFAVDDWEGGPHGGAAEIAGVVAELRARLRP